MDKKENVENEAIFLLLHEKDNVLTALEYLSKGTRIAASSMTGELFLVEDIPYAHKFARVLIPAGDKVIKYGEVIGKAVADIPPGAHVHTHNVVSTWDEGKK
jgi:altronate dehydratase